MFEKDDELVLKITDLGTTGEGIGKIDGYTLFVKDAVIGDTVKAKIMKAKKNYGFARLIDVIEPSEERIAPVCPVARSCGGCQLQCMSYKEQLKFKEGKVFNNIKRIGGINNFKMSPIIKMENPFHYRNKSQFPVGTDRNGNIVSGFYAGRTHSIINIDSCPLGLWVNGDDFSEKIMDIIKRYMRLEKISAYNEVTGKGLVRHVLIRVGAKTGQIMVCIVINGDKLPNSSYLINMLCKLEQIKDISININKEKNNVILGNEVISLYGPGYIEDNIGNVKFRISPLSFFQVNPRQTEKLYGKAMEYARLTGEETVWDLYCGIGSISLYLAKNAKKVMGVEIVPDAVRDAKVNAEINKIHNVEFLEGAAEEVVPKYFKENKGAPECTPDVIVVDPPRKGCDEKLLTTIVEMAPERIVYVSCDSATLARDIKWLSEKGYELLEVTPCDMFPQTVHVETVCLLSKLKTDQHIKIDLDMSELDLTAAESKATYDEIKAYIIDKYQLKVSSLNIAQVKQKFGIIERENFNKPKSDNARQPHCPKEKEKVIVDALKHFEMI